MSSLYNGTCPIDQIPEYPGLPGVSKYLTYVTIPGRNPSDPWMVTCCGSSPVHVADTCWLWCEVDPAIVSNTTSEVIVNTFFDCLHDNDQDPNISQGAMLHPAQPKLSAAQGLGTLLLRSVVGALATSMVVAVISRA